MIAATTARRAARSSTRSALECCPSDASRTIESYSAKRAAQLKPKAKKLNPLQGAKRAFGPHAAWEGVKVLVKSSVVAVLAYGSIRAMMPLVGGLLPIEMVLAKVGDEVSSLLTTVTQVNPIWVRFSLAEPDFDRIRGAEKSARVKLLNPDGSVPNDNPFVGQQGARPAPWLTLSHDFSAHGSATMTAAAANETVLYGLGELHLRVMLERMSDRYGVKCKTHPPSIPYRETVTRTADGHCRR